MLKRLKRDYRGIIIGSILTLILVSGIYVYASGLVSGNDVSYDNTSSGLTSTSVNGALTELYGLYENSVGECPEGYICKPISACEYEIGKEWDFSYSGNIQEFVVPCDGLYQLEVWGAQGGYMAALAGVKGGNGGYSTGYIEIDAKSKLYIVIGGQPSVLPASPAKAATSGGYNGGGTGYVSVSTYAGGSAGGGATHIATKTGVLSSLSANTSDILIVAGGGGGSGRKNNQSTYGAGGAGGNTTASYSFGQGQAARTSGDYDGGAGGGGWNGGSQGASGAGGTGGSSYVGGVPAIVYEGLTYSPSTTSGVQSGDGKAKITLIAR